VREVRRERLAREAGGADRRLLDVDPLSIELVELSTSALDERTGVISLPLVVVCRPSWNISSRATCGL
jgi:hypothetical protein